MSGRRTALAAALSLLPLGQPLLLVVTLIGITTATTAVVLQAPAACALEESASFTSVARLAKATTVRIEGATEGSGVLVKREGNRYTVLTAWHVVSGNRPGEELAIFTPDGKEHQLEQGSIERLGMSDEAVLTFSNGSDYEVAPYLELTPFGRAGVINAYKVLPIAKAITVRIETASSPGSGVLVKKEGNCYTVLTAWHVVSDNRPGEELAIFTPDRKEHQLEHSSIQRLGQVDMAVLTFSSSGSYEVASIGDAKEVKEWDNIFVAGFSLDDSENFRYETMGSTNISSDNPAVVVSNNELGIDQGYQLLYDNTTVAGMSGGPLLNTDGELIGIHGRGEKKFKQYSSKYVSKTGVNQGVPITYYELFASGKPVVISNTTNTTADDYLALASDAIHPKTKIRLTDQSLALRTSSQGYLLRAMAKRKLGDYHGAIADLDQAIIIDPKCYYYPPKEYGNWGEESCYMKRAGVKRQSGDYQGALADYSTVIAINPKEDAQAYRMRGITKSALKDYQGAIDDYTKAIANWNNKGEVNTIVIGLYLRRGDAKSNLKDYQGAIVDYNKVIELDKTSGIGDAECHAFCTSWDVYWRRGIASESLGRLGDACFDWFKTIIELPSPTNDRHVEWESNETKYYRTGLRVVNLIAERCKHQSSFNYYKKCQVDSQNIQSTFPYSWSFLTPKTLNLNHNIGLRRDRACFEAQEKMKYYSSKLGLLLKGFDSNH